VHPYFCLSPRGLNPRTNRAILRRAQAEKCNLHLYSSSKSTIGWTYAASYAIRAWDTAEYRSFRILRLLGEGGMGSCLSGRAHGAVFAAGSHQILHPHLFPSICTLRSSGRGRCWLRSIILASFACWISASRKQDCRYIVMEYVDGIRIDEYCDPAPSVRAPSHRDTPRNACGHRICASASGDSRRSKACKYARDRRREVEAASIRGGHGSFRPVGESRRSAKYTDSTPVPNSARESASQLPATFTQPA